MKLKIYMLLILIILSTNLAFGKVVTTLSEVMKPSQVVINEDRLYVTEETTIYVYDLNSYKFIKKFGKDGEGPREFKFSALITPYKNQLLISSHNKLSFYSKNGDYIKEIKGKGGFSGDHYNPLDKGYVGIGSLIKKNEVFYTINLFDEKLEKKKELARIKTRGKNGKINPLQRNITNQTYNNKIYITGAKGFTIDVLDHTGKKEFSIEKKKYERRKFNAKDEKKVRETLKKIRKRMYENMKNKLSFPDYYPEIFNFFIADDKLYVATWKWEKDKIEFFIFDLKGKELNHLFIPFEFSNPFYPYPAIIKNNKLYQIIENEETEEWELHVNEIK